MRNRKSKKDMKISGQYKKHQRTNNDLQNTRQKTKDRNVCSSGANNDICHTTIKHKCAMYSEKVK